MLTSLCPIIRRLRNVGVLILAATIGGLALLDVSDASEGQLIRRGQVLSPELSCIVLSLERARRSEQQAIFNLQDIVDDAGRDQEAIDRVTANLNASMADLGAAVDGANDLALLPQASEFSPDFFPMSAARLQRIINVDALVLERLEVLPSRSDARKLIRSLTSALQLKNEETQFLLGVTQPAVPRDPLEEDSDGPYVPVRFGGNQNLIYTFDAQGQLSTGLSPAESEAAVARTQDNLRIRRQFAKPKTRASKRDRFLSFRGKKRSKDGRAFLRAPNSLLGPFDVEFSAGLFRKARKKHAPDAFVTVEFDVQASDPLEFFLISTRYFPGDNTTPSGTQVFTGSAGPTAHGDHFFPGATAVDVRVIYEDGAFSVFARPIGGEEQDYLSVATWSFDDGGRRWELGVGGARLRKGTELGIDNLILTPR